MTVCEIDVCKHVRGLSSSAAHPLPLPIIRPFRIIVSLAGLSQESLPEILCDAEAEYARRGGWERVFPCPEEPLR